MRQRLNHQGRNHMRKSRLNLYVDSSLKNALTEEARRKNISLNRLCAHALDLYVQAPPLERGMLIAANKSKEDAQELKRIIWALLDKL